jgi:hypothetical protein
MTMPSYPKFTEPVENYFVVMTFSKFDYFI